MSEGHDTRFSKGRSGNPKGRPRKPAPRGSAFDVLFDELLRVKQNGIERELTAEEVLRTQTYQAAIKGNKAAIHKIFKMIAKREAWIAQNQVSNKSNKPEIVFVGERDTDNAFEAMLLLNIAVNSPTYYSYDDPNRPEFHPGDDLHARISLETWALDAAKDRACRCGIDDGLTDPIVWYTVGPEELRP